MGSVTDQPPPVSAEQPRDAKYRSALEHYAEAYGTDSLYAWVLAELQAAQDEAAGFRRLFESAQDSAEVAQERVKELTATYAVLSESNTAGWEREKALREALVEIVGFAQEVQRGTPLGDAHECGKHIERIALAAQRTEEAGG